MRELIGWLRSIKCHRMDYSIYKGYAVADWGGWIPGAYAKTKLGAYLAAVRARLDGRI